MSLRVISGIYKGRRLLAPAGLETRPLPDRIKQSLFDWLGQDLQGLRVADVCSGSGSFACEALSRGAIEVHAIESARQAQSIIRANLQALGSPPGLRLVARPFQEVLPGLHDLDLIFCDPPFPWFTQEPQLLSEMLTLSRAALAAKGRLFIRGERGHELPTLPRTLRFEERRFFGRSYIVRLSPLPPVGSLLPGAVAFPGAV
jgi:16S rRNA (guanine966-N2)-methyltransferase